MSLTLILFADSSAILRAYLDDEVEHGEFRRRLLAGDDGLAFVTADEIQRTAARALGIATEP